MCLPAVAGGSSLLAPILGTVIGGLLGGSKGAQPAAPAAPTPPPTPQAAKQPDVASLRAGSGSATATPGAGATMLTGAAGVDPASLQLGKNTLLGR